MKNLPETLSPLQKRVLRRLRSLQNGSKYSEVSHKELADYFNHKNRSSVQRAIINLARKKRIEIIDPGGSRTTGGKYHKMKIVVLQ